MMAETERRRHRRFGLALPVEVRVNTAAALQVRSCTKDVSSTGIYFTVAEKIDLGSELECLLTISAGLPEDAIRVRCRGKVVRVEKPDAERRISVAASIEEYEFLRPAAAAPAA